MFDLAQSSSAVTNNLPGRENSGRCNLVQPTFAGARYLPLALFLEDVAENGRGRVLLQGVADYAILQTAAAVVAQRYVASGASAKLFSPSSAGDRIVALVMQTGTTTPNQVWFDGVSMTFGIWFGV